MSVENLSVATSTASKKGVVIIGAGLAGWHVIDAIRAKDTDISITLITADSGDRYHKPMLTMAISQNKRASDLVRASGSEAAKTAEVTLLANTQVTDIDPVSQTVQVRSTAQSDDALTTIGYEKMVLAMGAHPIFPKSLPQDLVWHVNHIERFSQLQEKLATGSQHVAIVGAGMVGTEIAEDLLKAGHKVTLIDLNDAPLSQMLPAKATARIAKAIESQGIQFLGGYQVSAVTRVGSNDDDSEDAEKLQVDYAPLSSDADNADIQPLEPLIVDHVIASTGLTVDEQLPTAAGVEFDRRTGIVVDAATLRTNAANIYAIGDCMSINGVACRYVAPLRAQAATIADDILGHEHSGYDHKPPMIRLKNKAISVMVTGVPQAVGNWQVKTENDDELIMDLLDDNEAVSATVTIKAPAVPKA
ncbi:MULTISPECIES: FAD-dependent oxidoreductase [Psychrobacter]|jgi:NAD(P)H-nitrite reductase large subunit|uniref:FAD-dependent oxidoreductase n=1 Tax=Psychrobacter TaxID=497 RepID=UPI000C348FB6|nr:MULTISPECIES: FAD-dependent oxidoreductase [Psychrobacter]MBA6243963.1 FAD-dependent oxidoreductase [Psychrobacter sp. Urea-trap-18]MBA6287179.1 FAD-dependent oxidoreductase [Psychrobacter sp. Urea-trap-16]MBA6318293.1 FAD-dependent oxidoreductase [Psychrobacter sp. Urea-trap-20]MBA6335237.1 FAD-dependent oxidoreductase [Psychrobacter sp. Urea-trap-19]PKG60376.1 FAD-dependent oxidoreductase [Psychrobacter sp. Choline-3u-12]